MKATESLRTIVICVNKVSTEQGWTANANINSIGKVTANGKTYLSVIKNVTAVIQKAVDCGEKR